MSPAISSLKFPFVLKPDQVAAVDSWIKNGYRGSIIYSTGTGKTEIAYESARRACIEVMRNAQIKKDSTSSFNILFLVPRIVLIEQNVNRLLRYNISKEYVGTYYGERKDQKEITISTYQSAINNFPLIENAKLVILDEVHLLSNTAFSFKRLFKIITADPNKKILGLTATINELDPKYKEIIDIIPPVKKYLIKEAVDDGRLAKPEIVSMEVSLTSEEKDHLQKNQ